MRLEPSNTQAHSRHAWDEPCQNPFPYLSTSSLRHSSNVTFLDKATLGYLGLPEHTGLSQSTSFRTHKWKVLEAWSLRQERPALRPAHRGWLDGRR